MLLCSKAHPATITHEFKDSDVYRPCPADSVYYAIALVSSLTVKIPFSCPITLETQITPHTGILKLKESIRSRRMLSCLIFAAMPLLSSSLLYAFFFVFHIYQ